jgi:hypothetical protein
MSSSPTETETLRAQSAAAAAPAPAPAHAWLSVDVLLGNEPLTVVMQVPLSQLECERVDRMRHAVAADDTVDDGGYAHDCLPQAHDYVNKWAHANGFAYGFTNMFDPPVMRFDIEDSLENHYASVGEFKELRGFFKARWQSIRVDYSTPCGLDVRTSVWRYVQADVVADGDYSSETPFLSEWGRRLGWTLASEPRSSCSRNMDGRVAVGDEGALLTPKELNARCGIDVGEDVYEGEGHRIAHTRFEKRAQQARFELAQQAYRRLQ